MHNVMVSRNAVWSVYDDFRTVRLNHKYYNHKLHFWKMLNLWLQLILALSVSSAVAGTWIFQTSSGDIVWNILVSIAAILAVYQPIGRPVEKIQFFEKHVTTYNELDYDLKELTRKIFDKREYSAEFKSEFELIKKKERKVTIEYNDTRINQKLKERYYEEVVRELPTNSFFIPN